MKVLHNQLDELRKSKGVSASLAAELEAAEAEKNRLQAAGANDDESIARFQTLLAKLELLPKHLKAMREREEAIGLLIKNEIVLEQNKFKAKVQRAKETFSRMVAKELRPLVTDRAGRVDPDRAVKDAMWRINWPTIAEYNRLLNGSAMRPPPLDVPVLELAEQFVEFVTKTTEAWPELA